MSYDGPHPDVTTLEAFALGRLGVAELDRVGVHLASCPACREAVQAAPDDHLVRILRRAPADDRWHGGTLGT